LEHWPPFSCVRKLNDFSRESSSDPFTSVPIEQILGDALALTQARFAAHGVRIDVRSCPADWRIDCRPSQVSQILLNLLSNAFDAVVGATECWVTLECHDRGEFFHFVVSDSGLSIPQDIRSKIMDPFFTTKPPGSGVGLGLSISSHIATTHGGSLRLDENSPRTRFILELPKQHAESGVVEFTSSSNA
jgi:two-component system sensor histidine kinase DctS